MVFFPDYTSKGATLSSDGSYRYLLWREWRGTHNPQHWRWHGKPGEYGEPRACLFIMLNPSTADAEKDDPTIRRCVNFTKAWKYERLEVVNLFAYRSSKPEELLRLTHDANIEGDDNSRIVTKHAAQAGVIICAWGAYGSYLKQGEAVLGWLPHAPRFCLGTTKSGEPKHPLYVDADTKLQLYKM